MQIMPRGICSTAKELAQLAVDPQMFAYILCGDEYHTVIGFTDG